VSVFAAQPTVLLPIDAVKVYVTPALPGCLQDFGEHGREFIPALHSISCTASRSQLAALLRFIITCCCCLQDFGEHGREFISSEVGLRLLQVLADPQQLQNITGPGKRLERLNAILEQTVLKVGLHISACRFVLVCASNAVLSAAGVCGAVASLDHSISRHELAAAAAQNAESPSQ
jgi:hypothetical protein